MPFLPAERVAATLGVAAAAARKVLGHVDIEFGRETFARLSGALRLLEEHPSRAGAQACADQFEVVRSAIESSPSPEMAGALEEAVAALHDLAAREL